MEKWMTKHTELHNNLIRDFNQMKKSFESLLAEFGVLVEKFEELEERLKK